MAPEHQPGLRHAHPVPAPTHLDQAIERMASPECRIVSLTSTKASYLIDGVTECSRTSIRTCFTIWPIAPSAL